ncbi:uncharacterized protein LOC112564204 isoform X1 [Pomacea canaliculata]|uniref:uncharacterized protein LOC112564204 isoform X1 n=1 Tax=Pomacea canaliculata TaxID=400727 RepID=UPI000D735CC1|nr:uncharacterized protein LOC112564204 isoform X1 [Pomacea canaliculata]
MASTWPPVKSNTGVNVSKLVAKLLHHDTVLLDLLGELMDCHCLIDRSSIASGNILVIHGDPRKVADVIHKVVDETDVKADENDKEVLTVLDSFKERFRAQFETNFEQDNSTFKTAFHRKISDEVKPSILSLTNKDGRLPLSRHQLSYLHCHLDHLREQVRTSWPESAVIINVQNEAKGQGGLVVSSKRHDFQGVINFLHLFMANIKTSSKELDASRALFLSGVKGQRDVTRLQKEHQCQISVILPGHQVLVRAESPTGHRLFLCEGNMAATDCNILVLPFSENQRGWTATQKRVLDRGLLTTKTELYTNWIGSPPKKRTLILRCPTPEAGETVMLVHVSDPTGGPSSGAEALTQELAQELSKGLAEARRISEPRGEFIAVPVAMSTRQSLSDNLEFILPVIQDYLAKEVISATVVLYLEKLSVSEKQKLVETLEKRINQNWKVQTDGAAVYEDNFSSPNLVVAGKMQDIETTFSKLQSLHVPSDIQKRACLLESMNKPRQVRRSPTQESEADAEDNKDIDKEDDVRTVCVDALTADDGELCQMYFQNNEQSGGGQLAQKTVVWDDDTQCWMITFEQRAVAARVASRQHTINGQPVDVKLVYTPQVSYPDRLLFHNVSESISRDYLTLYLERITGQEVTDLMYADKAGDVLVVLDEEPDFTQVQEMCRQKKLEGQELWVSRVPVSNCILLENLSEATSEDTVMYYFSNKRSGGGPVEKVVFQSEQRKCLVFFYNHEVIENILGKTHALDGSQLQVRLYIECLGPSGGRRDASPFTLPSRVEFKDVDKYKMVFIRQSAALQQRLVELLTALHAKLISADNLLSVECTLTTAVPHASQLAASWTKDVQDAVKSVISMVVVLHQEVMQDVWTETEKAVAAIKPTSQDSALILVLAENRKFIVVGVKNLADDLMKQVKQIVTQKEEEAERKKQEVTETRKLKPFQLHLLTDMSFQSEVAKRHPALKVEICIEKGEISYQGLIRDVKEAQVEMYELLMTVRSKKLTMSNLQKTILSAKEGRDYVVHKFHVDKLVAVWDVDRQGEVTVYSCSDSDLAKAIQIMQKSVVQHQKILEPETTELLMSSQWTEFVSKLAGDHSGVLKISHVKNDHQLLLAGIDSIMSGVIDKTEKFLKENTIYTLSCHFFPSRQFFVANYWWARVISISNNLKAYKIEVTLVESGHQFHIRGTQAGLETMTKNLEQLGSEVKCHIQTLVDQYQVKFLLSPNCKRDLEKLGRSTRCVFSLKEEPVDLVVQSDSSQRLTNEVTSKPSVNQATPKRSSNQAAGVSFGQSRVELSSSSLAEVSKLFVYGESDESIRNAFKHFDDLVKGNSTSKKIVDDVIQDMTEDELRGIRAMGQSWNVKVKVEPLVGQVIVDGMHADVFGASNEIIKIIRETAHYRQQANKVQWCFLEVTQTGTEQKEYGMFENHIMEFAYQQNKKTATLVDACGVKYIVDFDSMKEYVASDPDDAVDVIRKEKIKESSPAVLPENWKIRPDKDVLNLVKLDPQSPEHQQVEKNFRSSQLLKEAIISIERIENPTMYRRYMAKKAQLDKQNSGICNEKGLWHCASRDALLKINRHGFHRSYCSKNDTACSQGVCFGVNSTYCANPFDFPPDPITGHRYIYQCRVLVGYSVMGKHDMRFLPARLQHIHYDSSTNKHSIPLYYVIFNDTQAYPEYLITFK